MRTSEAIRTMLAAGGSRLHAGRAEQVAALVFEQPRKVSQLIQCLWDDDPAVASRAAGVLETVSSEKPGVLAPWRTPLLGLLAEAVQNKLRWNLALIVPRLELTDAETRRVSEILQSYLQDRSSIVKTCAMQGLADLTRQNDALLPEVIELLRLHTALGTPAMQARGRMLLKQLDAAHTPPSRRRRSLDPFLDEEFAVSRTGARLR